MIAYNGGNALRNMTNLQRPRSQVGRIAGELVQRYFAHDVARDSAALTYYLLFAIFPLLIFVSTIIGKLELDIDATVAWLAQLLPAPHQHVPGQERAAQHQHGHPAAELALDPAAMQRQHYDHAEDQGDHREDPAGQILQQAEGDAVIVDVRNVQQLRDQRMPPLLQRAPRT